MAARSPSAITAPPDRWPRPPAPAIRWLPWPAPVVASCNRLLDQQFWLFGADIRFGQPNLLERFGFCRSLPPRGVSGSHRYTVRLETVAIDLHLWGFGCAAAIAPDRTFVLSRFDCQPRRLVIDPLDCWQPGDLQLEDIAEERADALETIRRVFTAFAAYERWVGSTVGIPQRAAMLEPWGSKRACAADDVAERWAAMAEQARTTVTP